MRSVCVLLLCVGLIVWAGESAKAQKPDLVPQKVVPATERDLQLQSLARELSAARKAGDVARVRSIEEKMYDALPAQPDADDVSAPQQAGWMDATAEPLWGNDVKIYNGNIRYGSRREIALDGDTLGNIFCAVNAITGDSGSAMMVYKSTDGGLHWSQVNGFIYPTDIVQSIDMCVTDTAAGKWLISVVWASQPRVADKAGNLYWGSFLSDGSNWRYTLIAPMTSGTGYRNPSICTDGKYYSPSVTYHYVAAEYVTPATGISRGLYINTSTTWGRTWTRPDTTIRGLQEEVPSIQISWASSPDSLLVACSRTFSSTDKDPRIFRNTLAYSGNWALTAPSTTTDNEFDPSFAMDADAKDGIISWTRNRGNSGNLDVNYAYSSNLFSTFTLDSIATSTSANEELSTVSSSPYYSGTTAWRVVYRTSASTGQIIYKWKNTGMNGLGAISPQVVNQYQPSGIIVPALAAIKWTTPDVYIGITAYAGIGPTNVWFDGSNISVGVDQTPEIPPGTYALLQNYPNPFNPTTVISYQLPVAGPVKLAVFDLLGREVSTLVDETREAGTHQVKFDGSGLPSGFYIYRLQAGTFTDAKKLVLVK